MHDILRFALDLSDIEEADDGNTTYYGGCYTLDGEVKRGYGNDRSDSYHTDIDEVIMTACHANWPNATEFVEGTDAFEDFQSALQNARDEVGTMLGTGTILVSVVDGKLTITVEN